MSTEQAVPASDSAALTESLASSASRKRRGRLPTTGKFDSRSELLNKVWFLYQNTSMGVAPIAHSVGVSPGVVDKILASAEGRPEPEPRQ